MPDAGDAGSHADLADGMKDVLADKAGFTGKGERIIVDENLPPSIAGDLRTHGYEGRSIAEMGLRGTKDPELNTLAQQLGASVLTRDRGRQLDGGFGSLAIQLDRRITSLTGILRVLKGR